MAENPLDTPIASALQGPHAALAEVCGRARRYPAEIGPFAAFEPGPEGSRELIGLVPPGTYVYTLDASPDPPQVSAPLVVESAGRAVQLVWSHAAPIAFQHPSEVLGLEDVPQMLDLTRRVYPAYFRARTPELGRYVGIRREGRLVAMAGVRMAVSGHREISAVCTDPAYAGRGFAGSLVTDLVHALAADGLRAFLHTEVENARARALYARLGFEERAQLSAWRISHR